MKSVASLALYTATLMLALPAFAGPSLRHSASDAPSVEIHLEALRELRGGVTQTRPMLPPEAPITTQSEKQLIWQAGPPSQELPPSTPSHPTPKKKKPVHLAKKAPPKTEVAGGTTPAAPARPPASPSEQALDEQITPPPATPAPVGITPPAAPAMTEAPTTPPVPSPAAPTPEPPQLLGHMAEQTPPPSPAVVEAPPPPPPPPAPAPVQEAAPPPPAPVQLKPPTPAPQQSAALPPASTLKNEGKAELRVLFPTESTTVPDNVKGALNDVAGRIKQDNNLRISIVAHASGNADQTSTARRVSLARALAVRAYLIDQGVDNLRINVQAEGNKNAGDQPDRVDLFLLNPAKS